MQGYPCKICGDFPVNSQLITCKSYILFNAISTCVPKVRNYGDFRQHVIPTVITCLLRGTPCDTGFSYTFYRGNICSVVNPFTELGEYPTLQDVSWHQFYLLQFKSSEYNCDRDCMLPEIPIVSHFRYTSRYCMKKICMHCNVFSLEFIGKSLQILQGYPCKFYRETL